MARVTAGNRASERPRAAFEAARTLAGGDELQTAFDEEPACEVLK